MIERTAGDLVRMRYTKWGGRRHHTGDLTYLGADAYGDWLGDPVGNRWSGGPAEFTSVTNNILLIPRDRWFTAMFYEPHPDLLFRIYCDIATPAEWTPDGVTAVDLDLDVIKDLNGTVFVDDEDEFDEHQVTYGYPAEVIAAVEAETARVADELNSDAPYAAADLIEHWRAVFAGLRAQA